MKKIKNGKLWEFKLKLSFITDRIGYGQKRHKDWVRRFLSS